MTVYLFFCLLPLSAMGALLGGYRPVDLQDPVIPSKLRPVLTVHNNLGTLPILRVEKQQLYQVTNYKVYQGIPNNKDPQLCSLITCRANGDCEAVKPCNEHQNKIGVPTIQPNIHPGAEATPKLPLLGGHNSAELKEVQEAVDFVVEKMNSMSNNMFRVVSEDVTNITQQVVNGMRYKFTLTLVSTSCRNSAQNKGKKLGECSLREDAERQLCHFTVFAARGNNQFVYSLEDHQCGMISRVNRSVPTTLIGGDGHDSCQVYLKDFKQYKQDYQRLYGSEEEEGYRFQVFCMNMQRIKMLQDKEQQPSTATYGINKFADMSEQEFRKYYLSPWWDITTHRPFLKPASPANPNNDPIPDSFDWRDHGAVTPVKDQGQCGSCWAFSTTGNIEGQNAIKNGKLLSLSEQELVDCDKIDEGCNGGLPLQAYEALMQLGGIETESDYKYEGRDEKCIFNRSEVAVKITGGVNVTSDENEMKAWLYKYGPISIGINAFAMQFYSGGISHPWKFLCNPNDLDHGVLIVGYGISNKNVPYWIIKNSWGGNWGEKGYYYVYRGAGVCGLNQMCTSATIN